MKTTMEFKITISGIEQHEDNKREYVKARLEDSIKKSSFEWRNNFTISNLDGYHNGYLDGLNKSEQIFNGVINKK